MLSDEVITHELLKAKAVSSVDGLRLDPLPRSELRGDYAARENFLVSTSDRSIHLTVGHDLGDLRQRTQAFAAACPSLACRPLFWHQAADWDFLGTEFFDGWSLTTLVQEGRMSAADALVHAGCALSILEETALPSSPQDAARELEAFFARVLAAPLFDPPDLDFLRETVFPFIRRGALADTRRTRWTNGDFTSGNILVDRDDGIRLVDYEFAARTHFFAEDGWRWRIYSPLPPEARDLPTLHGVLSSEGGWLETYFILRQFVLARETNGLEPAAEDAAKRAGRLVSLLAEAHPGLPTGNTFRRLRREFQATAQIYWSTDGSMDEKHSAKIRYPVGEETTVRFQLPSWHERLHLRFDPAQTPGRVTISRIRVLASPDSAPLLDLAKEADWDLLRLGPGVQRLAAAPLTLLSLNDDPNFYLSPISAGAISSDLFCEVTLCFMP